MLKEQLFAAPGFLYAVGGRYYYLGKWICSECTDTEPSDCAEMYRMCRAAGEEAEAGMYFQKIRAYSDFALEVPYNPGKISGDMSALIDSLTEAERENLCTQYEHFEQDYAKYCRPL